MNIRCLPVTVYLSCLIVSVAFETFFASVFAEPPTLRKGCRGVLLQASVFVCHAIISRWFAARRLARGFRFACLMDKEMKVCGQL